MMKKVILAILAILTAMPALASVALEQCAGPQQNTFCSGMETLNFADWDTVSNTGGTVTMSTAQVANGSYSAAITGNGTDNRAFLTSFPFAAWTNNTTYFMRFYIYLPSASMTSGNSEMKILGTPGGIFASVNCSSTSCTGMSFVGGGGSVFIGTLSTSAITLNAWHDIEVSYTVSSTVGGIAVLVDGTSIGSSLTSNTSADVGTTQIQLGQIGDGPVLPAGGTFFLDNFQMNKTGPIGAFAPSTITPVSYFLSPTGSDSNTGLSTSVPWLTPNHPVNCGDTITAAASTSYAASSFASGEWGTVTCGTNNNVAWLQCATFDGCKIAVTSGTASGMVVSASYWGVQGFEVDNTAGGTGGGSCFTADPASSSLSIHHIIFANDIANVCPLGGVTASTNGQASVDYFSAIGNISFGAGQTNTFCGSGFSVFEPVAFDSLPGTHIYMAGNFSIATTNPATVCFDGNGFIFDTFDGDQTPLTQSFTQQGVMDNNMSIGNGGNGLVVEFNNAGPGPNHAHVFVRHNTAWGDVNDTSQVGNTNCGEAFLFKTTNTEYFDNLVATNQTGCYGDTSVPLNAFTSEDGDATSHVYTNVGFSATGTNDQIITSGVFAYGPGNLFGTNPTFANAVVPSAPSCGSATSVPNCMATVIANFTPTNAAAKAFGYQPPSTTSVYDPLYPQWLCSVTLPSGLVTPGCLTASVNR
jgi:hypothetical protein